MQLLTPDTPLSHPLLASWIGEQTRSALARRGLTTAGSVASCPLEAVRSVLVCPDAFLALQTRLLLLLGGRTYTLADVVACGAPGVDAALGGGFWRGKLYDVVANVDGAGHRVVATLAARAAAGGSRVLWVETTGAVCAELLHGSLLLEAEDAGAAGDARSWLARVSVAHAGSVAELRAVLAASASGAFAVVVVSSLAHLVRAGLYYGAPARDSVLALLGELGRTALQQQAVVAVVARRTHPQTVTAKDHERRAGSAFLVRTVLEDQFYSRFAEQLHVVSFDNVVAAARTKPRTVRSDAPADGLEDPL